MRAKSAFADLVRANLRRLRHERLLTGAALAERMGISRVFYVQIEGGRRGMSVDHLDAAARALGVPVRLLVE